MKRVGRIVGVFLVAWAMTAGAAFAGRGAEEGASAPPATTAAAPDDATPSASGFQCFDNRDFISYRSGDYFPFGNREVAAADVGPPVGYVSDGLANEDSDFLCYGAGGTKPPLCPDEADGTAPALATGTQIYALPPYATSFRLVAERDGRFVMYEIYCTGTARVGADALDIRGWVVGVAFYINRDQRCATNTDPATITALVDMILGGRVERGPGSDKPVERGQAYVVRLQLDDGTEVSSALDGGYYWLGTDRIVLPREFMAAVQTACGQG